MGSHLLRFGPWVCGSVSTVELPATGNSPGPLRLVCQLLSEDGFRQTTSWLANFWLPLRCVLLLLFPGFYPFLPVSSFCAWFCDALGRSLERPGGSETTTTTTASYVNSSLEGGTNWPFCCGCSRLAMGATGHMKMKRTQGAALTRPVAHEKVGLCG